MQLVTDQQTDRQANTVTYRVAIAAINYLFYLLDKDLVSSILNTILDVIEPIVWF